MDAARAQAYVEFGDEEVGMRRSIACVALAALLWGCSADDNGGTGSDASEDQSVGQDASADDASADTASHSPVDATVDAPQDAGADAPAAPPDATNDVTIDAPGDAAVDAPLEAATDATTDATTDAPTDATSDAIADAPSDAPQDAVADAPADAQTGWVYVRIGDCSGNDRSIGYSTGSDVPVAADCATAQAGLAAVCWDQTTYTNGLVPGSAPGCTYKTISASSCTGGSHQGYLYVCTPP
jgi:hypothetical protein